MKWNGFNDAQKANESENKCGKRAKMRLSVFVVVVDYAHVNVAIVDFVC